MRRRSEDRRRFYPISGRPYFGQGSSIIADNAQFYRDRASTEQANADAASLDNVRDRCDRAAKAWTAMADRAERTQSQRAAREAATDAARIDASNDTDDSSDIAHARD